MSKLSAGLRRCLSAPPIIFSAFFLCSCATPAKFQSKLDHFVAQNDYNQAESFLNDNPNLYGRRNTLLYFLDSGFIRHLSKDYRKSIEIFEKSKSKFDELYTKSVTGILSSWVINDYTAPYRGEDFERVMINIFQSLNYIMLGNREDALVEARDVDSKLNVINSRYKPDEKNVYKEDAFARFLMGIIYESSKTSQDYNDAFISYAKAVETYENDYAKNYDSKVPEILKENILAAAKFMGPVEFAKYRAKFSKIKFLSLEEKEKKAEVYLIQYNGLSAKKEEAIIPIPFPDGYIVQYAFPVYSRRSYFTRAASLTAKNNRSEIFKTTTELGEDISAIAIKNLDNRKARFIAKAAISSTGKYLIERNQAEGIRKRYGNGAEQGFKILSSLFNIFSSRADIRSWQTLPSEIRIARLLLEPGEYEISASNLDVQNQILNGKNLGKINLSAGEKRFFIIRSMR